MDGYEIVKQVIQMLDPVVKGLDCTSTQCSACGQKHYVAWEQKKIADNIQAAITRLLAASQAMQKNPNLAKP